MKNNIPTIQELLIEESKKFSSPLTPEGLQLLVQNVAYQTAKLHVEAALKAAAKNAKVFNGHLSETTARNRTTVDIMSILNAYPLDLIK